MLKRLDSLVSRDILGDIESSSRIRILFYFLVVMLPIEIFGLVFAHLMIEPLSGSEMFVAGGAILGMLAALLSLIRFRKPRLAFAFISVAIFVEVGGFGYLNGGIDAPAVPVIIVFPVCAAAFLGDRWGKLVVAASIGLLMLLLSATEFGLLPEAVHSARNNGKTLAMVYGLLAFFLYFAGRAYGRIRKQTQSDSVELSRIADLGTLADGVSHEINNPMTVIVNSVGILKKRLEAGDLTPETKKLVFDNIHLGITRVVEITNALNLLSKSGANAPLVEAQTVRIVGDAFSLCQERFVAAGIDLTFENPQVDLLLRCRSAEITGVLAGLLSNSFDAVRSKPEKWVRVSAVDRREGIEIRVTDSGPGVNEERRGKLFTPFSTTKAPGKGMGLSLFLGREVLSRHQGRLYLDESAENTTFVIFIPTS